MIVLAYAGVAGFCLALYVVYFTCMIDITVTKKLFLSLSAIISVSFAFIAYCSYMGTNSDLYRYFEMLNGLSGKSLRWALSNFHYHNNVITTIYFWLISRTGNNHLLPFLTTFIIFILLFYVMYRETQIFKFASVAISLYFIRLISVVTFHDLVGGVRQALSLSVLNIAIYRDFIRKKRDIFTFLLYIIACAIHTEALVFVLIRICTMIRGKLRYIFLIWSYGITAFIRIMGLSGTGNFISEAAERFITYRYEYERKPDTRFAICEILLMIILLYWLIKDMRKNVTEPGNEKNTLQHRFVYQNTIKDNEIAVQDLNEYYSFMEMMFIFTIGAYQSTILFYRLISGIAFFSLPIIGKYQTFTEHEKWNMDLIFNLIITFGMLMYQLVYIRSYWRFVI